MSDQYWLTVITVVKDDPEGFKRTVMSLLKQDLGGVEHVIVDSSGDATQIPGICETVRLREHVAHLETIFVPPEGIYGAMNQGLLAARGTYTYFLNSGDELARPDSFRLMRNRLETEAGTWLFGRTEIVDLSDAILVTPDWDYKQEQERGFSSGHFPGHQSTVASTETLRSLGGFDTRYKLAADYDAFLQLSQVADPVKVDEPIGRFHEGGASTMHWARTLFEFHRARRARLSLSGRRAWAERTSTVLHFLKVSALRSPWPLAFALAVTIWGAMVAWAVPLWTAFALTAYVALQALGGALWWRLLQPRRSISVLEAIGIGLGLGTASATLTGLMGAWWAAPLVAGLIWAIRRSKRPYAPLKPLSRAELVAVGGGLGLGLLAFAWAVRSYPLTWVGRWGGYHGDMLFFEALANSVARLGAGGSAFMAGAELRYHSLAYGWAGELSEATSAAPFVVLTRLLPLVTLVATIALTAAWTRTLTLANWAPSAAVLLVITGGFVGATYGGVLNFDSPSQSLGVIWLLAMSVVALQTVSSGSLPWQLLPVAVLAATLTGGKVSTAAVAGCGVGFVAVAGLAHRSPWRWRAATLAVGTAAAMLATYLLLLAGSANAGGLDVFSLLDRASSVQSLNPVVTPRGIIAGIVILAIAVIPRWAGLVWLVIDPAKRWEPQTLYGIGLVLAGIFAILFLSGGFNDLWFAVAASAPLSVLSVAGVAVAVASVPPKLRTRIWIAVAAGFAIAIVVALLWATGSSGILGDGWRWAGPLVGLAAAVLSGVLLAVRSGRNWVRLAAVFGVVCLVSASVPSRILYGLADPLATARDGSLSPVLFEMRPEFIETIDRTLPTDWTDTQAAAGAWLRSNSNETDLLATNVTYSALVPALTHRTTLISNIHIQAPYGDAMDIPEIQRREIQSWGFASSPSLETLAPLCEANVRWVWVDPSRTDTRNWDPYAQVAFAEDDVIILRIIPSACT